MSTDSTTTGSQIAGNTIFTVAPPPKPQLILPGLLMRITDAALECFPGLRPTHEYFTRDNLLVHLREEAGGKQLHLVTASEFASDLEKTFDLVKFYATPEGPQLRPANCSAVTARLLLDTQEAITHSFPLNLLSACPVLVERLGVPIVLQKGYHLDAGGLLVLKDLEIPDMSVADAVHLLVDGLFADHVWVTPSDLSRAIAQLLSPCLKLGNLLPGVDFPLDVGLADQSQSGKTFRMRFTSRIYGEAAYVITRAKGGVGSVDEKISSALISGKAFILFDNIRGEFDSELLEGILRGAGSVAARIPHRASILIPTDRVIVQLTSNSANLTRDITNRAIITNSREPPEMDVTNRKLPWGEAFFPYVDEYQAVFLGAIHTIAREWIVRGKPRTDENRHAFTTWTQSMDWIVQELCQLPPLLDGHLEIQRHLTNKYLAWFRELAFAVERTDKLNVWLQTTDLLALSEATNIATSGLRDDMDDDRKLCVVGKHLSQVFGANKQTPITVEIEDFTVTRILERNLIIRDDVKKYIFRRKER